MKWITDGTARSPVADEWFVPIDGSDFTPIRLYGAWTGGDRLILTPLDPDSILVPKSEIEALVKAGANTGDTSQWDSVGLVGAARKIIARLHAPDHVATLEFLRKIPGGQVSLEAPFAHKEIAAALDAAIAALKEKS